MKQEMMGWPWHQLDHIQITCTSLQTDNHATTPAPRHIIFYRQMLFLMPNEQCQSTEGNIAQVTTYKKIIARTERRWHQPWWRRSQYTRRRQYHSSCTDTHSVSILTSNPEPQSLQQGSKDNTYTHWIMTSLNANHTHRSLGINVTASGFYRPAILPGMRPTASKQ